MKRPFDATASAYDRETVAAYVQQRHDALVAAVDAAVREICEYASAYDVPVLVTEDSHYRPPDLPDADDRLALAADGGPPI